MDIILTQELSEIRECISNGGMAIDAYLKMRSSSDPAEIAGIRKALLEYCKLDTMAMVKILDRLKDLNQN